MFYAENIPWLGVNNDDTYRFLTKSGKSTQKVAADTSTAFIEYVVSEPLLVEETFNNLDIATDGDVAALAFDYTFSVGGHIANSGKEMWHLVRTADGWKISSVIYSVRTNQAAQRAGN